MDNLFHYPGLPSKNVIGKINDKVVDQGRDYFIIRIQQPGSYRIEIYDNSNSTPKLVSSEFLDAVDMPDPVAAVAGKSSGFISTKELMSSDSLSVLAKDARKQNSYHVLFFRMTIKDAQFGLLEFESNGNHLSTEMKQAISRLGNGAAVSFENIKALLRVRGAGISVSLNAVNFIIEK
jgi:hypothetical protein